MTTQQPTREQVVQWAQMGAGVNVCGGSVILGFQDISNICALARADLEASVAEQAAEIERIKAHTAKEWVDVVATMQHEYELRQQLSAAQEEIERLKSQVDFWIKEQSEQVATANAEIDASNALRQQLAAAHEEIERLNGRIFTLEQCREANRNELTAAQLCNEKLREALESTFKHVSGPIAIANHRKKINAAISTQPDLSAIEAERQRVAEACASLAKSAEEEVERIGKLHAENSPIRDRMFARAREAGDISAAITAGQWKDYYK